MDLEGFRMLLSVHRVNSDGIPYGERLNGLYIPHDVVEEVYDKSEKGESTTGQVTVGGQIWQFRIIDWF